MRAKSERRYKLKVRTGEGVERVGFGVRVSLPEVRGLFEKAEDGRLGFTIYTFIDIISAAIDTYTGFIL